MTVLGHDGDAWARAEFHLAEATLQDANASPVALVHSAYYAMFHAARACLLRTHGAAPKKHSSVVKQFAVFVHDRDDALTLAGQALQSVRDLRVEGDYIEPGFVTAEMARETREMALRFLALCAERFGFRDH